MWQECICVCVCGPVRQDFQSVHTLYIWVDMVVDVIYVHGWLYNNSMFFLWALVSS